MEKKKWTEWEAEMDDGSRIYDPDGFRDQSYDTLYTFEEFLERRPMCTMIGKRK